MIPKVNVKKNRVRLKSLLIAGLGLAFCAGVLPAVAQQNQDDGFHATIPPPDSQDQSQPAPPAQQQQAPESAQPPQPQAQPETQSQPKTNMPPQAPPEAPAQDQPYAQPQGPSSPQAQGRPNQPPLPPTLTLPAGTVIRVRVDEWLSSDRNVIGDNFSAVLEQPVVVDGWVVARRGQAETGRVTMSKKGGHGTSQLGLDLPDLTLVDGQQLPLQTQLFQTSGGTSPGRDAAIVGSTTGLGAVIGAIAGRGVGAAIGAGVGATAGIIGVMSSPGRPATVAPETVLSFKMQAPVTISTQNSQLAFQPVKQSDYNSRSPQERPQMRRAGPPPPPAPYYPYPYAYGYPYGYGYPYPYGYYPGPYIGFGYYGGYRRFGGYWR